MPGKSTRFGRGKSGIILGSSATTRHVEIRAERRTRQVKEARARRAEVETFEKQGPSSPGRRWRVARRMRVSGFIANNWWKCERPSPAAQFARHSRGTLSRFAPAAKPRTGERDENRQSQLAHDARQAVGCPSRNAIKGQGGGPQPMHSRLFIGGSYVESSAAVRFADIEPATERVIAELPDASAEDVDRAVAAAREAADKGPWPRMSADERAAILNRLADGIERRAKDLGTLEARDVGKPVAECVNHDIARAAKNLRFFAAAAQSWTQEAALGDAKFLGADFKLANLTERPPLGVGAIIIPWNSPLMLGTWNLGPCLAAGNTCLLKPSELAPLTSLALGEIAAEAGLPPGVLNIVTGLGATGAALVGHREVDAIAFTGGVTTGQRVMAAASERLARVTLELGGKSPNLVFRDADLKQTAAGVARSIFR